MSATTFGRGSVWGFVGMLTLVVSLGLPATATAASAAPVTPVGRYRLTSTTVKSHLDVSSDHTFQIEEFGDSGTWAQIGDVVALGVYAGPDGGCVFVGVMNASGISGKSHPGNFSCAAPAVFPMYARRLPPKGGAGTIRRTGGTLRAALTRSRSAAPAVTDIDPTGTYTASRGGNTTSFLVSSDHTVTWPDLGDSGSWAEFNDVAAFVVTSFTPDRGCISIGRVHTNAINSAKLPGESICPGDAESLWFARRLVA